MKLDHVYTTNEDARWAVAALVRTDVFSVTVKAGDDALLGTDSVTISGGDLTLEANGDAVTSSKDDDEQKGWIRVTGGTLRAAAGDDALADTTDVLVEGARWSSPPRIRASMRGALRLSTPVRSPSPPTTMAFTPTAPSASATALSASLPATITGGKVNVDKPEEALEGGLVTVTSRRGDVHRH